MSTRAMARGREFRFDLTVEIAPGVGVSSGELGELISDGLLALEAKRLLFPDLREQGHDNWLLGTSIECTGYSRPADMPAVDNAYASLMEPARRRRVKAPAKLVEGLQDIAADVGAAILRLRMLQARLDGLADTVARSAPAAPDTTSAAAVALAVATAILGTIGAEMKRIE